MLLIDTNVAIHLRDAVEPFVSWVAEQQTQIAISLITLVELRGGIAKSPALAASRRRGLRDLLDAVAVVEFDRSIVDEYGSIIQAIGFSRSRILDRLIAATAIIHNLPLVTINGADFRDIPGLKLEVWPAPDQ